MLAEYVVLHEDGVVQVPEHLTDEEAATLPCAAVTSWHALISEGNLKAGDSVLVQGTGGVSIFGAAIRAAKTGRAWSPPPAATPSSNARSVLGASDGINYKTTPDWEEKARELTGGSGVDHIVEVGGAGTFAKSLRAVRMNGRIYLIGILSGSSGQVNPMPILMKTRASREFMSAAATCLKR